MDLSGEFIDALGNVALPDGYDWKILSKLATASGSTEVLWSLVIHMFQEKVHTATERCLVERTHQEATAHDTFWTFDKLLCLRTAVHARLTPLRETRRLLLQNEDHERSRPHRNALLRTYRRAIEAVILKSCQDLLRTECFQESYIAQCLHDRAMCATLWKLRGDLNRYSAEVKPTDTSHRTRAADAYEEATHVASVLASGDDARLSVALNYSVFLCEVMNAPDRACTLAKAAVDATLVPNPAVDSTSFPESSILLKLRENLTVWMERAENPTLSDAHGNVQEVI